MIEMLMCDFRIDSAPLIQDFDASHTRLAALYAAAAEQFPGMISIDTQGLAIRPEGRALARLIARAFDAYEMQPQGHSSAI